MKVEEVLHMNQGDGETSYAQNSIFQGKVIDLVQPIIEKAIQDLYTTFHPESLAIADLGCSTGSNSLLVIYGIIDAIYRESRRLHRSPPEFLVFLNDLPGNDFNTLFSSLPDFYGRLRNNDKWEEFGSCFMVGVPGSFYGRLFPNKSLHFVHSSSSLHWLSQTPSGLFSEDGFPLNKGKIYASRGSPSCVLEAYLKQFQKDFSSFLKSRSEEMVDGGRMVLELNGRRSEDLASREGESPWEVLGLALNDMVSQGLIEEEKFDSFNVPYHTPSLEEVDYEIKSEGSFAIETLEISEINFGDFDDNHGRKEGSSLDVTREQAVKSTRALSESMVASHFGEGVINYLFQRLGEIVADITYGEEAKTSKVKGKAICLETLTVRTLLTQSPHLRRRARIFSRMIYTLETRRTTRDHSTTSATVGLRIYFSAFFLFIHCTRHYEGLSI